MINKLIIELDYNDIILIQHLSNIGVKWRNNDVLSISPSGRWGINDKYYFTFNSHGFDRSLYTSENSIYLNTKFGFIFFKECKCEKDLNLILTTFINIIKPISDKLIIDYKKNNE